MKTARHLLGFCGIVAVMGGWAYLALTSAGPKPAWMYVYAPAVVFVIVGAAVRAWWVGEMD